MGRLLQATLNRQTILLDHPSLWGSKVIFEPRYHSGLAWSKGFLQELRHYQALWMSKGLLRCVSKPLVISTQYWLAAGQSVRNQCNAHSYDQCKVHICDLLIRFEIMERFYWIRDNATHRAWQQLPRHLRRRAASHDVRRVPVRLREKAKSEVCQRLIRKSPAI